MHINCDIGERGADHPVDRELMNHISLANIACGGHAGDRESIEAFLALAKKNKVSVSAHLSYPDRENFGRFSMDISTRDLLKSLDDQFALMGGAEMVKFHGALYNDCWVNRDLSRDLASWLNSQGVKTVVTPYQSCLAEESLNLGMDVLYEAFAERRYAYDPEKGQLTLVSRNLDYASIHDLDEAVSHAMHILTNKEVEGHISLADGSVRKEPVEIKADTICIHSDSPISLELAQRLSGQNAG